MSQQRSFFLLLIFYLLPIALFGQSDDKVIVDELIDSLTSAEIKDVYAFKLQKDSLAYQNNAISHEDLEDYKRQKIFQYPKRHFNKPAKTKVNFLDRFFESLGKFLDKIFGFHLGSGVLSLIKYVIYISLAILLLFLLSKLTRVDLSRFKIKKKAPVDEISFENIEENLEEVDFDELIEQALVQKNYRVATRLFFLKTLQILTKNNQIQWSRDKTNHHYKYELKGSPYARAFDELLYLFENIWYGHYDLEEDQYEEEFIKFKQFEQMMQYE